MSFKASDYLITPKDFFLLFRSLFRLSLFLWAKIIVLVGAFFLATHFGAGTVDALFILFFVAVFIFNIEARVPISLALFFLVAIVLIMLLGPYTEYVNETTWPEAIAVWVYYLLAIGVLKQTKDLFASRGESEEEESENSAEISARTSPLLQTQTKRVHALGESKRVETKNVDPASSRGNMILPTRLPPKQPENLMGKEVEKKAEEKVEKERGRKRETKRIPRGLAVTTSSHTTAPRHHYRVVKDEKIVVTLKKDENDQKDRETL